VHGADSRFVKRERGREREREKRERERARSSSVLKTNWDTLKRGLIQGV